MRTLADIASDVCEQYSLFPGELTGKPRECTRFFQRFQLWPARREFVRRALATGHWSSADIARFMGRDSGTVRALKRAALRGEK